MDLTTQVKNITEAVQSLFPFLNAIATTPGGAVIPILLCLGFLLNLINRGFFLQVFDILEHKERKRLEQINEYVSSHDAADPETIKVVRDLRDAHYFNVATGIYAENRTRSAFIKMHHASSHCIAWKHIERARPYIEIAADETITIRDLTLFEELGYWYNQFVAYGSLVLSVVPFLIIFVLSDNKNMMSFVFGFGSSLLIVVFAFFVFFQNLPIDAKKRIAKELERLRDCSSDV
jgi:hypothetical protein